MDKNQFHYQRVTQSDYRGGATRQTKDKKEKIEVDLPILSMSDSEKETFKADLETATSFIFTSLVGDDDFFVAKQKCLDRLCKKMGLDYD